MTSAELLPPAVLKRKAVVYIRQSTQAQVQSNLESQRRQYDRCRRIGPVGVAILANSALKLIWLVLPSDKPT